MSASFQLALPFSLREAVSVRRVAAILGVHAATVYRMIDDRVLETIQRGSTGYYLIRYSSLVEYCDMLRETFQLPNLRPVLSSPLFRHHDRDIPPFPLEENVSVEGVMEVLQIGKSRAIEMANAMTIPSYQLTPTASWRFYRPAVEQLVQEICERSKRRPSPRYQGWTK